MICPKCNQPLNVVPIEFGGRVITCTYCGFYHSKIKVRFKPDYANDLGMFKHIFVSDPWGSVSLNIKHEGVMVYSIPREGVENFLNWLSTNKSKIISAELSYYQNNQIIRKNLLDSL